MHWTAVLVTFFILLSGCTTSDSKETEPEISEIAQQEPVMAPPLVCGEEQPLHSFTGGVVAGSSWGISEFDVPEQGMIRVLEQTGAHADNAAWLITVHDGSHDYLIHQGGNGLAAPPSYEWAEVGSAEVPEGKLTFEYDFQGIMTPFSYDVMFAPCN